MKLKVDVITLQAVQNYGSVLQALATQKVFEKHNLDVTIINYVRPNVRYENLLKTWSKGNPAKALAMIPTINRWKSVFRDFCIENLNQTEHIYSTTEDFKDFPLDADLYCTGSDQVWNSNWNQGIIPELYLSFIPAGKYKFAFAASFGQSKLSTDEVKITKPLIDQYSNISVRESSAVNILESQYHYNNVTQLVDPTLSVDADFWRKFESKKKVNGNYILIYNLNRSKAFDDYAKELSKISGLKLVRLCTRYDQFYRTGKSILVPTIPEFISLIDNARYVLTDSFHATAFSMNMNTEPICIYPKMFGGRLESFLTLTDSLQRHVIDYHDFDILNRPVNFDKVNKILSNERSRVDQYIEMVIKDYKDRINEPSL